VEGLVGEEQEGVHYGDWDHEGPDDGDPDDVLEDPGDEEEVLVCEGLGGGEEVLGDEWSHSDLAVVGDGGEEPEPSGELG